MSYISTSDGLDTLKSTLESLNQSKEGSAFSEKGEIEVSFGNTYVSSLFVLGNRSYQREKVASIPFKQGILQTVLENAFKRIPQIHILVKFDEDGKVTALELMDGQQRFSSLLDFVNNEFPLASSLTVRGVRLGGLYFNQLDVDTQQFILNHSVDAVWYMNLNSAEISDMFVDVLNNTNDMKPQEKRNAYLGEFPEYVRDTSRTTPKGLPQTFKFNPLFERVIDSKGKETLKHFSKNFKLNARMEVDQWVSQLAYLSYSAHDWTDGISQQGHSKWVKEMTTGTGAYAESFTDKKFMDKLLSVTKELVQSVPSAKRNRLTPAFTHILALYYMNLTGRLNSKASVTKSVFANMFISVLEEWNDKDKALFRDESTYNGNPMPPALELFGGYNKNAIMTIKSILDKYDPLEYGVTFTDDASFPKEWIVKKLEEQGGTDYYTGLPLDIDNAEGDHYTAKSAGGKTEYSNLVVCSRSVNRQKSNMSAKAFIEYCEQFKLEK